ncbi:titin-like%2C partial, partial [Scomber scombrus]
VPIATVRWIRTDLQQHVFFKQNGYLDTAGQDPSYVNRVRLMNDAMMVNGELSLIVNKMNSRDTGTYQCYYKKPGECYTDELFKLANTVQLNGRDLHILVECGGTITMPCRAPRNAFIRDVEWIRSDPDRHVYHQRSKRLVTEDQDPSYVNRVQLEDVEMKNGDLSLILKNVSSNDEGRYECRYKEIKGRRKRAAFDDEPITIVYLKVTGPTDGDAESGKLSDRGDSSVILPVTLIAALVAVVGLVGFVIFKKLKGRSENNRDLPDDDPDVLQQLQENENSQ